MRLKRILAQGVWYEVRTAVNNREMLFRLGQAAAIFFRVLRETRGLFAFEIRGLALEGEWLSFYIRPEDGLELPAIMQWMKQTFAARYNRAEGRIGHIWGDRYWSGIVEGEPPEWAEGTGGPAATDAGVRPHSGKNHGDPGFSLISPLPTAPAPG
jgi:hypothetical protein